MRGATIVAQITPLPPPNFNPRTPCGVRRRAGDKNFSKSKISIHAPLAGCDSGSTACVSRTRRFQSTHPLRGATYTMAGRVPTGAFQSTHPLRGATFRARLRELGIENFNPRTPCGVRPRGFCQVLHLYQISIHAPLAGCDRDAKRKSLWVYNFNPRTPCGVRLLSDGN